jgi:Domain of unknown function (DUF5110)
MRNPLNRTANQSQANIAPPVADLRLQYAKSICRSGDSLWSHPSSSGRLIVIPQHDEVGNSVFTLYEDQNDGYGYERGLRATIRFEWNHRSKTLTVESRHGDFPGMTRDRKFLVVLVKPHHGVGLDQTSRPERVISYTGSQVIVQVGAK